MRDILENLNSAQKEAVLQTEGPVLILAGAGSGKTRALTHRLAYLISEKNISLQNILAVTFTNKAADEMRKRMEILLQNSKSEYRNPKQIRNSNNKNLKLSDLENSDLDIVSNFEFRYSDLEATLRIPWLGTFHSMCAKILRREAQHLGYPPNFTIYDSQDQLAVIKRILRDKNIDPKRYSPNSISYFISSAKNEFISPKEYAKFANSPFEEVVHLVYVEYQKQLFSAGAMDFDDLLCLCVKLFEENPKILEKYQRIFKYILIDEYQDTNRVQYLWVKMLSEKSKNVCVVGDDSQSIYGFRGANFRNILNFERDYPGAKVIKLEQNYRSTKNILRAADQLIKFNRQKTEKNLWTENSEGQKIIVCQALNEKEEAEFVALEITSLIQSQKSKVKSKNYGGGFSDFSDFAVLYRTNAQSRAIEEALLNFEIPYKVIGGIRFYQRKEVKDILAYLRLIVNQNDQVSFTRAISTPSRGVGEKTLEKYFIGRMSDNIKVDNFLALISNFKEKKSELTLTELIEYVAEKSGLEQMLLDGTPEGEARWENILELKSVASYSSLDDEESQLDIFLEKVALYQDSDDLDLAQSAVTLMTLHSAKGLEFPVVFIVGVEEGILPHGKSLTDETELEEERRLCYVGITRAMNKLYMLYSQSRIYFGNVTSNVPSRFLEEIPEEVKKEI
ncbi:MAG: DNA helicase II / ATP-dependent DNA helicase PcrA [Candidatus Berkelbacteria bacterium Athens1014_28]|uniref:DNA 3'-5' helicase n=1 Tax=Candidatus Berkelbacteria bacterium Athens1014_28 TaxID=2017145 RepID=A0A554LMD9_9BACT|nr:MAG: DNA helicase II / ATP-dependent DNA helicase PcrA [Candidatus Berkelbacteria bacterium Athens1014_28]